MPRNHPPGELRLKTTNYWTFHAGTPNESHGRGACSSMVGTWLANLLCGGNPFGDGAMAVPEVLQDKQEYGHEKQDGMNPFGAEDRRPFYYLRPCGLWETDIHSMNIEAEVIADYLQTMIPMQTSVYCNVWRDDSAHAVGLHTSSKYNLFFEPNHGVYELDMSQWKVDLPAWMTNKYRGEWDYHTIDMFPVELIEASDRRQHTLRRETRSINDRFRTLRRETRRI